MKKMSRFSFNNKTYNVRHNSCDTTKRFHEFVSFFIHMGNFLSHKKINLLFTNIPSNTYTRMMDDLRFYVIFNRISVTLGWWVCD